MNCKKTELIAVPWTGWSCSVRWEGGPWIQTQWLQICWGSSEKSTQYQPKRWRRDQHSPWHQRSTVWHSYKWATLITTHAFCNLFYWAYQTCSHSSQAFKHGGRRGAKKVMIVITDGESHDSADLQQAIEDSEKDGITRYAIAVSLLDLLFTWIKRIIF